MLSPRWRKVLHDIWGHKLRAALITLSIAVGVFAVGTVAHMNAIISRDLDISYAAVSPAQITISTLDTFPAELTKTIAKIPGVAGISAQRRTMARFQLSAQAKWHPIELVALANYDDQAVNKVRPEPHFNPDPEAWLGGSWPPPRKGVVLERTSLLVGQLGLTKARRGDSMTIEMGDGTRRDLNMAGLSYDLNQVPATFAGRAYGYISLDTLEALGQNRDYNTLQIAVADTSDRAAIEAIAHEARRRVERGGLLVGTVAIHEPGKLPLAYVFTAITIILGTLGVLVLALSGLLVVNTISALLGQHTRQIGVMKAVGARASQLAAMYLSMVALFGLIAVLIAMPLARGAAWLFTGFLSYLLNFQISEFHTPTEVLALELAMGLLVPLLAGLVPILRGTRITVREALASYGLADTPEPGGRLAAVLEAVQWLPRPLLLMLRNSVRRQGRLALTLAALSVASAAMVMVLSLRVSMTNTVDQAFSLWRYNVLVLFEQPYGVARAERVVRQVPGVLGVESWSEAVVYRRHADTTVSAPISLIAPPADTRMLGPIVIAGRWLRPGDTNALVIDAQVLKAEPDMAVGSQVALEIYGKTSTWQVVGVVQTVGAARFAYANYDYAARLVHQRGRANRIQIVTAASDNDAQSATIQAIENALRANNLNVTAVYPTVELRAQSETLFTIITSLLLLMALLLSVVGGLGLAGTMSLNVLERTREIGMLRAVGASRGAVMQIVLGEGLLIGVVSWLVGTALAFPLGRPLSDAVGMQFFQSPLAYTFSIGGAFLWLLLLLGLSALASYASAQRAASISVRAALAAE